MNRDELIERLLGRRDAWDLIVVGGGATGVGVALDAASRGYEVLLLEQHDFGKGTSSRSTKLVHGGVRYLEQGARWFVFLDRDLTAPPDSPADGDAYLVDTGATGAWSGHDGEIAWRMSTAWEFIVPSEGMAAYVADEDLAVAFDGTDWSSIGGSTCVSWACSRSTRATGLWARTLLRRRSCA